MDFFVFSVHLSGEQSWAPFANQKFFIITILCLRASVVNRRFQDHFAPFTFTSIA